MERGKSVTYYTHNQSDFNHSTEDALALVISDAGDAGLDLVIFPAGGPVRFERVREYDPDRDLASGCAYYRGIGDEPPDFSALDYANDPAYAEWRRNQEAALAMPQFTEQQKKARLDRLHELDLQRDAMTTELDGYYGRTTETVDEDA